MAVAKSVLVAATAAGKPQQHDTSSSVKEEGLIVLWQAHLIGVSMYQYGSAKSPSCCAYGAGGPGEEADKEGPELGATTRGQAGSRAYPKSRQRKV